MKRKTPKPDGSKLEDWVEPITLRGRWGRVDSSNKGFVDRSTVYDITPAFAAEFDLTLTDISEGADPPDILARCGDRVVSIELAELLKESVRQKKAQGQAVTFEEQLWTEDEFIGKLNARLDDKHAKYSRRPDGFIADALLIHTCELWLDFADVERWLSAATVEPRATIRSAYFAQEHLPNCPKPHWPLFRLYGNL